MWNIKSRVIGLGLYNSNPSRSLKEQKPNGDHRTVVVVGISRRAHPNSEVDIAQDAWIVVRLMQKFGGVQFTV